MTNNDKTTSNSTIDDTELHPESIDPNHLLLEIEQTIRRFIVCDDVTVIAAVLWTAMTWFIDVINVAPLAVITAPEKRCGKSQLLFLLNRLVRRPLPASNISSAALFRAIDKWSPTILIDEADTFMKDNEDLRGILNCGHTRDSAFIIRVVGKEFEPHRFNVWGAKALAGIGHLPSTIMDRSIVLKLRRKMPHEHVERLRHVEDNLFKQLQSKLARFMADYKQDVLKARPTLPANLNDREQDNWEPLLIIADIAGGDWPDRARAAALQLAALDNSTTSVGTDILLNIKEVFEHKNVDRISTADLINELCLDDEQPWATHNYGKPITPRQIASLLKEYGIKSKSIRIGCGIPKGFEQSQFEDAFSRYLAPSVSTASIRHTPQINSGEAYPVADSVGVAATRSSSATVNPLTSLSCCGVVDKFMEQDEMATLEKSWEQYCS